MLLLHGFTDTWRAWTPIRPALEAHHDVICPSLPGHFGGEPFAPGVPLSLPTALDMIERQLDVLGIERAHLVGSSLGGWLALALAARGRGRSVVALCPAGGWTPGGREERFARRYFMRNKVLLSLGPSPTLPYIARPQWLRWLFVRELVAHPERLSAVAAWRMFEGAKRCTVYGEALSIWRLGDLFGDLAPIPGECRVRVAYGTRDRVLPFPAAYQRMIPQLPGAEWVALEGLGHLPMWDDPAEVARAVLEVSAGERGG